MKWEFVARTCSLAAKKSYRSAEFPNSAEKRKREFAIPTAEKSFACHRRDARIPIAEKISIFARTNFCRYATMRVANSRLFTVAELQIRQNKGKNVRLQPRTQESASKDDVPILARPFLCSL